MLVCRAECYLWLTARYGDAVDNRRAARGDEEIVAGLDYVPDVLGFFRGLSGVEDDGCIGGCGAELVDFAVGRRRGVDCTCCTRTKGLDSKFASFEHLRGFAVGGDAHDNCTAGGGAA